MSSKHGKEEGAAEAALDAPVALRAPEKTKRAPSPRNCREFIRRETARAMLDIVNTFVGEAKKGSVAHFTSLTKVGGFDQRSEVSATPKSRRKSLARQLLDEVERYEAKQAAELAAANASPSQIDSHAASRGPQEAS